MQERLLQYIWQHQYFNHRELRTEAGEPLQIISPGTFNTGQGPDFLLAEIRIGQTRWTGHIELHIRSSDWDRHRHENDPYYRNVILHVVWEDDRSVPAAGISPFQPHPTPPPGWRQIPVFVLGTRIAKPMVRMYSDLMTNRSFVPCAAQLPTVGPGAWANWKETLLVRRLQRQARDIFVDLAQCHNSWETATWWRMARNFGIPVNGDAFEAIARSLPVPVLIRHRHRPDQLESLLLGQAGLLDPPASDDYTRYLHEEYVHLRTKYRFPPVHYPLLFPHMRPASSPALRLAQLADLLRMPFNWLSRLKEATAPEDITQTLRVQASAYWNAHYSPGTPARTAASRPLGMTIKNSLLINTFIPILYAYGSYHDIPAHRDAAIRWMRQISAEKNARLTGWRRLGVTNLNAGESQALLELKKHYCDTRQCLSCAIGRQLLSPEKTGIGNPEALIRQEQTPAS